tara:strand:+ start:154 stop:426 length:273 start_codon:yes stop_codon:yes gene_type:complete
MTANEAREIRTMLVDEINRGLRKKFKDPEQDFNKIYRYSLPIDWMPVASSIKRKYRDAGWDVQVSIEISCGGESGRDCFLIFTPNKKRTR